jgi:hypothetical protein
MTNAVRSLGLRPDLEAALLDYFEGASLGLINRVELGAESAHAE